MDLNDDRKEYTYTYYTNLFSISLISGHRTQTPASDRFVDFVCRLFVGTVQEDEIFLGQCRRMKYFWDSAGG